MLCCYYILLLLLYTVIWCSLPWPVEQFWDDNIHIYIRIIYILIIYIYVHMYMPRMYVDDSNVLYYDWVSRFRIARGANPLASVAAVVASARLVCKQQQQRVACSVLGCSTAVQQ